jgi:hypothetical protein
LGRQSPIRRGNLSQSTAHCISSKALAFGTLGKEQNLDLVKDSPGLHLKTYFFILLMVFFAPMGNVLLSKGMKGIGSAEDWALGDVLPVFFRIMTSGYIWLGISCLLVSFGAYMLVLTWADYSYVQPASAFSYAVVALLGYSLMGEAVPPLRWVGIGVICLGVFVVGRTPPCTTGKM